MLEIVPVSMIWPIIIGICMGILTVTIGLYLSLTSPNDTDDSTRDTVVRVFGTLGLGSIIGLVFGTIAYKVIFNISNPKIVAMNFVVGETLGAITSAFT